MINLKNSGIFPVLLEQIAFVGGKNGSSVGTQERNILDNNLAARQAQELASGIGVVLWDRDSLIKLIHTSGLNDSSELADIEEVASETDDLATITAYKAGDPECQPSISQEDLLKELEHDDA